MTSDRYQCCSCLAFLQKLSIDIVKRFQAFHCSNIDSESKLIGIFVILAVIFISYFSAGLYLLIMGTTKYLRMILSIFY